MRLELSKKIVINQDVIDAPDLCDRFSEYDLDAIGALVWKGYQADKRSRVGWEKRMNAAMNLAMQIQTGKSFPWPGCSDVIFPLVTIAALQFSTRSYANIITGTEVVRYRVIGEDKDGQLSARAKRIGDHMSWQMLEQDEAWEEQHDRLLINLGIVGSNFIKSYYSPAVGHNVNELVLARDLVMNYWSKSTNTAPRKTQVIPRSSNDIYEEVMSGAFRDILDEGWFSSGPQDPNVDPKQNVRLGMMPPEVDEDTPFETLEQHRLLDLDGDGYAEPYIVTIEAGSQKVLRLVARYDTPEAIERKNDLADGRIRRIHSTEYFTKFGFIPAPDGGIYDLGFGTLIGPINEAINAGINQLIDSGTMANSNGGFLGRGAKIRGGQYTFAPWEWKRVDSTGDDLRKSLVQLPVRDPSNVIYNMINLLITYADRLAGTVDQMVGQNPGQNTPAETSRNTVEQGMQVYSSIFKRVWRSLKEEFGKNHQLNARFLKTRERYGASDGYILREDYKSNPAMVVPVADPNITSAGQRFMQAQALREAAHTVPGYDIPFVERYFLRSLRVETPDQFYPGVGNKGYDGQPIQPLPNPKLQVEELKQKAKEMELQQKKWEFVQTLQEQRRMNNAHIAQLEAQAIKLVHDIGNEKAALQIQAFDTVVKALKTHSDMMTQQIETLAGVTGNGGQGGDDGEGVPGMAGVSSNRGVPQGAPAVAG